MEKELNGYCTWDELSINEQAFYAIQERDREIDKEVFNLGKGKIERQGFHISNDFVDDDHFYFDFFTLTIKQLQERLKKFDVYCNYLLNGYVN